jgi:CRISPR type I-E-associated protein CasB/Cse2
MADALFRRSDSPEVAALRRWHRDLLEKHRRGDRAELRRAGTIGEAAMAPAFHDLLSRLGGRLAAEPEGPAFAALAGLAALAAVVQQDTPGVSLGHSLSRPGTDTRAVSPARFRRLLACEGLEDRLETLRRLVLLLGRRIDLAELAKAVCDWTPESQRRLAYDYYENATAKTSKSEETAS